VATLAEREYPADMRERGVEGTVTLRFTIDANGRARDPEAISQSGLEFVEPAKRVVQQLRFQAASYEGRPVEQAVAWFQVRFRLRPPAPSPRGEPRNEEVLLRAAIERFYPDLLRQEPARTPWVYLVVDERGNVVRRALDWTGPSDRDLGKALRARFPDLPGGADALSTALPTRVRTGISGGREIQVYWAVLKGSAPSAGAGSWGPFPLGAVATPLVSEGVVRRALTERYPEVLQRASEESVWFLGYPDGEVIESGRTAQRGAPAAVWARAGADTRSMVSFQRAADGGVTHVLWIVPDRVAPGDPNVVSGTVRDASGNPVAGAVVLLRDRPLGAATGADGRYAFRAAGLPAGGYALLARHPAGAPAATREVTLRPGASVTADFVLPAR
jgi:TonB family protein